MDDICGRFIKEAPELMRREFEREGVKLHATVMNSKFLEQKRGGGQLEVHKGMKRYKPTISINATELLKVRLITRSIIVAPLSPSTCIKTFV